MDQARRGAEIIPIAGGRYGMGYFQNALNVPFFAAYEPALDTDCDGAVTALETLAGFDRK